MKVYREILVGAVVLCAMAFVSWRYGPSTWRWGSRLAGSPRMTKERRQEVAGALRQHFESAGVSYPPPSVALLAFKQEKRLEVWAGKGGAWVHVRTYPILAASGHAGPKLREGDGQVPEGVYRIIALNPHSNYHLSMKLNYPNGYDLEKARLDGRTDLGGDIFIHGRAVSIGCIAMGDAAIEELFRLAEDAGISRFRVVIAPNDLRGGRPAARDTSNPSWTGELHETVRRELAGFSQQP